MRWNSMYGKIASSHLNARSRSSTCVQQFALNVHHLRHYLQAGITDCPMEKQEGSTVVCKLRFRVWNEKRKTACQDSACRLDLLKYCIDPGRKPQAKLI
jgi:hypothetical protein